MKKAGVVKAKIAQISGGLPPGVTIEPFYDRSDLISRAIDTLKHTLWEAVLLVTLMHVIFLFHFRSILTDRIITNCRLASHLFIDRLEFSPPKPSWLSWHSRKCPGILRKSPGCRKLSYNK